MDKQFGNLYKTLVSAVVIIAIVISGISIFLYDKMEEFAMDVFADSIGKNSVVMAKKVYDTEEELINFSYRMLTEDRNIMLLTTTDASVTNDQLFNVQLSLSRAAESYGVSAIVFYRVSSNRVTHRYYENSDELSEKDIRKILDNYFDKMGYFSIDSGEEKGNIILYISPAFNECKVIYKLGNEYINGLYDSDFDSKYSNFYLYKNSEYCFSYKYDDNVKKNIDNYKIKNDKNYYVENNKLYILNHYYDYSVVSEINMNVFSEWKKSVFFSIYIIFGIILVLLLLAISLLYFYYKKNYKNFEDVLKDALDNHDNISIENAVMLSFMGYEEDNMRSDALFKFLNKYNYYSCCCLRIDDKNINNKILEDNTYYLIKLISERFSDYNAKIARFGTNRIGVVCVNEYNISENYLTNAITEIQDHFYKQCGLTVTAVISGAYADATEFVSLCQKTNYTLIYSFFYGNGSVIKLDKIDIQDQDYPQDIERDIIEALNKNDEEASVQAVNKFFTKLVDDLSPFTAKKWLQNLVFSVLKCSTIVGEKQFTMFVSVIDKINNSETLSECIENIMDIFPDMLFVGNDNSSQKSSFMRNVEAIVKKEFVNPDFNVTYVAERLGMTSAYFGQKFLKENDITFNAYLTEYRINCAMELLKTTKLKIEDVALRSGFVNTSYFIKVFKQNATVTPASYRKKYISQ